MYIKEGNFRPRYPKNISVFSALIFLMFTLKLKPENRRQQDWGKKQVTKKMLEIKNMVAMVGVHYSVSKGLWIQWQTGLCAVLEKKKTLKYKHRVKKVQHHAMEEDKNNTQRRGKAGTYEHGTKKALLKIKGPLHICN